MWAGLFFYIQLAGTQCVAMVACSYLLCVSRYMERRGIEVGQVELMLYIKPLQGKQ